MEEPYIPEESLDHSMDCCCGHQDCPAVWLTPILQSCGTCNGTGEIGTGIPGVNVNCKDCDGKGTRYLDDRSTA